MVVETWIKPNGSEIQINEDSAEYAESLGWRRKNDPIEEPLTQDAPKRRGRPPKARDD